MRPLFFLLLLAFSSTASYAQTIAGPTQPTKPTVDAVAAANPVLGTPTETNLREFRRQLILAATEAQKAGEITRAELFSLRLASRSQKFLVEAHQAAAEQVLQDGVVGSYGAIDWTQLLSFLKEILPIILQLISLFS